MNGKYFVKGTIIQADAKHNMEIPENNPFKITSIYITLSIYIKLSWMLEIFSWKITLV